MNFCNGYEIALKGFSARVIARSFCDAHFARKRKLIVTKHFERNCGHFLCPQNPPVSHSGTVPRRLAASNVLRAGQPLTRKSNASWESVSSSVRRYLTIYAQIRAPSTIRIDAGVRLCRPLDRFQYSTLRERKFVFLFSSSANIPSDPLVSKVSVRGQ